MKVKFGGWKTQMWQSRAGLVFINLFIFYVNEHREVNSRQEIKKSFRNHFHITFSIVFNNISGRFCAFTSNKLDIYEINIYIVKAKLETYTSLLLSANVMLHTLTFLCILI